MESLGTTGRLIAAAVVLVVVLVAGAAAVVALSGHGTAPHIVASQVVSVGATTSAPPVTQTVTTRTVTVPAAPAPAAPRPTPPARAGRFTTGHDAGEATLATACRVAGAVLTCWTPNDGFTVELPRYGSAFRARSKEAFNRGRQPAYAAIGFGERWRSGGFSCVSRKSGLTCANADGHGWTLPRYRGLPAYF
jgi:hypothetical protein